MTRRDPQWDTSRLAEVLSLSQPEHCAHISGFSTDTRTMAPGQVFIALRGERVDGHDFVEQAHARGAAAIVVDHDMPPPGCMVVPDTLRAYAAIAADHLRSLRPGLTVVAVTGSSGKTSTKDLMASVFGAARRTVAAEGSLNNEVGLPATVLSADGETQVLVLEMGMRGLGHIAYLCRIAPPDISLVLNVGSAHIGELGSREAIAAAKSEIVLGARPGATSVLNADDPLVSAMAARAPGPVLMFGQAAAADVRATDVALSAEGAATFRLHLPQSEPQSVELQVLGRHQVMNALAAAAAAHAVGLSAAQIAAGLVRAQPRSRWRMERRVRADGLVVINDAYNANPESMAVAIEALAAQRGNGRTVAVLGEMRELGSWSEAAHLDLGRLTRESGIDLVIAVGTAGLQIANGRGSAGTVCVDSVDDAVSVVTAECGAEDVVLCKASRSIGLERVGIALLEQFGTVIP